MMKLLLLSFIFFRCSAECFAAKPNIIIILTDDQDALSVALMSKTLHWANFGVRFNNAFSTTPVCCPARSSFLTGLYQHNHRVFNNSRTGNCNGDEWQQRLEPISMGPSLQGAGYTTFYAGKYLNAYRGETVPPGWDWWAGLVGNSVYYNYTVNVNGTLRSFGSDSEDYLTDVLLSWTEAFLRISHQQPFFMVIAPPAAHEPFTPSIKYKGRFKGFYAPRSDNFNTGRENKHWLVSSSGHMDASTVEAVDAAYASRLETLLSVDDLLQAVVNVENTYVLFTSDHGFHMGQFSMPWDKRQPYEADIRVPLIVSGPLVAAGSRLPHPILNIDIAPTVYELAGVQNPPVTDGKSFVALLTSAPPTYRRTFRIEYKGEGGSGEPCYDDPNVKLCQQQMQCKCFDATNNTFTCARTLSNHRNTIICKFDDDDAFIESYDLNLDPYQLNNLAE